MSAPADVLSGSARYCVVRGDCREVMAGLADASVDSVVTDPPYELGFMGKRWDASGIAFNSTVWAEVLRVMKPGAYLIAFGGTRTAHRMVGAIEDAGFEIRDSIVWMHGQGFPKSLNLGDGRGTALKPAHEPICLARKPFASTVAKNVQEHGTGALNIDASRVYTDWNEADRPASWKASGHTAKPGAEKIAAPPGNGIECHPAWRWPANVVLSHSAECVLVGRRRVRGSHDTTGVWNTGEPGHVHFGPRDSRKKVGFTAADGTEEVDAYECVESCPVRALDEQSNGSSRFFQCLKTEDEWQDRTRGDTSTCETADGTESGAKPAAANCINSLKAGGPGSNPTGQSSPDTRSTTGTTATQITHSTTSNALPLSGTTTTIRDFGSGTERSMALSNENARGAMSGCRSQPTSTAEQRAPTQGTVKLALPRLFENGEQRIESNTTHISANITADGGLSGPAFLYQSKPSTAEREAGCEALPRKSAAELVDREAGAAALSSPRTGAGRTSKGRANHHPTVKSIALMRYLVRLITPPGGVVLDPFTGSGTTGCATVLERCRFIGMDLDEDENGQPLGYVEIARARIEHWSRKVEAEQLPMTYVARQMADADEVLSPVVVSGGSDDGRCCDGE